MRPILQIKILPKYAQITVDLWPLPPTFDMDKQQREAIVKLIHNYIVSHWNHSCVRNQYYSVGADYASFVCLKEDVLRLKAELEKIVLGA